MRASVVVGAGIVLLLLREDIAMFSGLRGAPLSTTDSDAADGEEEAAATVQQPAPDPDAGFLAGLTLPIHRPSWLSDQSIMTRFQRGQADVWAGHSNATGFVKSLSQDAEEQYAYSQFFYGRTGGTFLEMGALDGFLFSNTYALESEMGWHGVLIEASPSSFAALARNRPQQVAVHVAVCGKPQTVHYADEGNECCRGIAEFMSMPFRERWHPQLAGGNFSGLPSVPCVPLGFVLGLVGIQHVNFYILDVEGGELSVLQAIDFSQLSFDVIVIEADGGNPDKDRGVIDLLATKGYAYHGHVVRNDWFVRQGFVATTSPTSSA